MSTATRFIIVDDDVLNNRICTLTLEKIYSEAEIKTFLDPVEGFEQLVSEAKQENDSRIVLFLDIAMPSMDGWEFLERFDDLDTSIKEKIRIYMLSSSDNSKDIERAMANKHIVHYLVKPFTKKTIRLITLSLSRNAEPIEGSVD